MSKGKSKKGILVFLFIIIIILLISAYFIYNQSLYKVILKDNLTIEINDEFKIDNYLKDIKQGKLIKINEVITNKLGNSKVILTIKNKFNKKNNYTFNIKVIDTTNPTIEAPKNIEILLGTKVDLLDKVKVLDNSKEDIKAKIIGEYDINKEGTYNLKYAATDSSGNTSEQELTLVIKSRPVEIKETTFKTSKGFTGKIVNGVTYIDGYLIVNKTYTLPENYGSGITKETQNAFNLMKNDANILGLNLYISSGYRSYWTQKSLYNNYVARDGKTAADTYSARPGHSEHQTGLAFDLNTINDSFSNTPEGKWVHNNCYKYGLILRYIKGKENQTGYMYESWHLRYVGEELAKILYNDGDWLTMEEYFGITSEYSY